MPRIDRDKQSEQLSAYFDGELNDKDRAALEARLQNDPSAREELARLRETAHAVSELPRHRAPESLAADVMATIERGDLLDDAAPSKARGWSWRSLNALLMTAAMIAVVITVGLWGMLQGEAKRSVSVVASSAETDGIERKVLKPDPRRTQTMRESQPVEVAVPLVVDMPQHPLPMEYYDETVDEVARVALPSMTVEVLGRIRDGRSGLAAGVHAAANIHLDVTCPNEADLRRCADRVNEFMFAYQGQQRSEYGRSTVTVSTYGTELSGKNDGIVTVESSLRIPSSRLRSLVDALEGGNPRQRGVALTIGTMVQAQGWRQSKQLSEMVFAQAIHDETSPLLDQPNSQELRPQRPGGLKHRTRPTAATDLGGGTDQRDAKTIESKKVLDEWLERFGVNVPKSSEREEETAAPDDSVEQDYRAAARSAPEQLISVTVRFRAPADPPPLGPPGQLVPRDR